MLERAQGLISWSWDVVSIIALVAWALGFVLSDVNVVIGGGITFVVFATWGYFTTATNPIPLWMVRDAILLVGTTTVSTLILRLT